MQSHILNDAELETAAQEIENFNENPATWGEESWVGIVDPLLIWEWLESQNRIGMMSSISQNVAAQIVNKTQYNSDDENFKSWLSKFTELANTAVSNNQWEIGARFLEALLFMLSGTHKVLDAVEEIISLHRKSNNLEKTVFYLTKKSMALNNLLITGRLTSSEDEIWKSDIEAYKISKEIGFYKGVTLALLDLGYYLGCKNKDRLALKFLYQAHLYSKRARTKFGIIAIDELRKIRDRSGISPEIYQIEINPDLLIEEFLQEIGK